MSIPGLLHSAPAAVVAQTFSQAEVDKLVAAAKEAGRAEGYTQGYAEAENHYNPPPPPPICPDCGSECRVEHTPFEQEYPGACYTPPQDWAHCKNEECGHCRKLQDYDCEGQIRENTRGW